MGTFIDDGADLRIKGHERLVYVNSSNLSEGWVLWYELYSYSQGALLVWAVGSSLGYHWLILVNIMRCWLHLSLGQHPLTNKKYRAKVWLPTYRSIRLVTYNDPRTEPTPSGGYTHTNHLKELKPDVKNVLEIGNFDVGESIAPRWIARTMRSQIIGTSKERPMHIYIFKCHPRNQIFQPLRNGQQIHAPQFLL